VLPLLALPFVTLAFWAMGGGRGHTNDVIKNSSGLNLQLPDAKLKDEKNFDKLSFYKQAEKDSLKNEEAMRNDPNYKPEQGADMNVIQLIPKSSSDNSGYTSEGYKGIIQSPYSNAETDANEQKVYKKINELNKQINKNEIKSSSQNSMGNQNNHSNEQFSREVDKLQSMMQVMNDKPEKDPVTEQLGGVLDKILDIQHPDRIKDKTKEKSIKNKQQVFSVEGSTKNDNISLMQSGRKGIDTIIKRKSARNSFYDLNNNPVSELSEDRAIEAVVHETQTVVSGSTVKLRLSGDIYINGILIPKGNYIYGTGSLENERLTISIASVRYGNNLLPVALQVYDMDGLTGIHIRGSISRDVSKQSTAESLQNIELTAFDPSIAVQAANTGIQAAKSLLTKKVKQVKVTLKAGYRVLLKDNNKNNN